MIRILSIEDDPAEAASLRSHIERYAAETGLEFRLVQQESAFDLAGGDIEADLVLLDIDLPGINGMEAAEALRDAHSEVAIIFVTNLAQYAVHGYAVDALDFIVKPVTYFDFKLRMDKAVRVLARSEQRGVSIQTPDGFRVVPAAQIAFVDVANHNVSYHLVSDEVLELRSTLSAVEKQLAGSSFVRISNNCLANMAHIQRISGSELTMDTGDTLWFSRSRRKDAMAAIARYLGGSV